MTTLTGGELVLRCLAREGIKHAIGITDEGYHAVQHHCREYGMVYPSKIGVYQGSDQLDWFRPHTRWNAVVHDWERFPEIGSRGFREALSGRPGPVQIDVPQNVMDHRGDASKLRVLSPHQANEHSNREANLIPPFADSFAEVYTGVEE